MIGHPNLISYYKLEGNGDDFTGYAPLSTAVESPTYGGSDGMGRGLILEGTTKYIKSANKALSSLITNQLTIVLDIKFNTVTARQELVNSVNQGAGNQHGFELLTTTTGYIDFAYEYSAGNWTYASSSDAYRLVSTTRTVWAMVFTANPRSVKWYKNGVYWGTTTVWVGDTTNNIYFSGDAPITIGYNLGPPANCNATIYECAIFNKALSDTDVLRASFFKHPLMKY